MRSENKILEAQKTVYQVLLDVEQCLGHALTNCNTENYPHVRHYILAGQKNLQAVIDELESLQEEMLDDSPDSLAGACEMQALFHGDLD
jgi:hypothetical protein